MMMMEAQTGYSSFEIPSVGDKSVIEVGKERTVGIVNNTPSVGNTVGSHIYGLYGGSYAVGDTVMINQMISRSSGVKRGEVTEATQYLEYTWGMSQGDHIYTDGINVFISFREGYLVKTDLNFSSSTSIPHSIVGDITGEGSYVYTTNTTEDELRKYNPSDLSLDSSISTSTTHEGGIDTDGTYLYTISEEFGLNKLIKRNCSDLSWVSSVGITSYSDQLTTDNSFVYHYANPGLTKRNCSDLATVSSTTTYRKPGQGITTMGGWSKFYISVSSAYVGGGIIEEWNSSTLKITATTTMPYKQINDVDTDGTYLYGASATGQLIKMKLSDMSLVIVATIS